MTRRSVVWLGALLLTASLGASAQTRSGGEMSVNPPAQQLPSDIPFKRDPAPGMAEQGSVMLAWGAVVTIALLAVMFAWRRGGAAKGARRGWLALPGTASVQSSSSPEVLRRTQLTPRHMVCVVWWEGEQYLIACTDQGVQLLAQRAGSTETTPQKGTP